MWANPGWDAAAVAVSRTPDGRAFPRGSLAGVSQPLGGTRTLYQSGVRLLRLGRQADAVSCFQAILDSDPANPEAAGMLALIARGEALAATPLGEGERPPARAAAAPGAPARRRRRPIALVAAAVMAAALAGATAAHLLRARPRAQAPPLASTAPPVPAAPQSVPGRAPPPDAGRPERSAPVSTRQHPALAEVVSPGEGRVVWKKAPDAQVRGREPVAELRVDAPGGARPGLARRVAELERLAARDPVYREFLEKARRDAGLRRRVRALVVLAPASGRLVRAADGPERVERGAVIARIVDPDLLRVGARLEGAAPAPDAACEVLGEAGASAPCRLVDAAPTADGGATAVTAEVAASAAPWIAGAGAARLRFSPARTASAP